LAENSITEKPQPKLSIQKMPLKFSKKIQESTGRKIKEIHQFILGMSPYPAAFTLKIGEEEKGLKIFGGKFEISDHGKTAGSLKFLKTDLRFLDGEYFPSELQLEGKKE
jgi:methionyl-tRNA formyltransferase